MIVAEAIVTANWRKNWPEMPGMKAAGMNTAREHQRDGDQRAADLVHGPVRRLLRASCRAAGCARRSRRRRSRRRRRCRSPAPGRTATGCSARSRSAASTAKVPISDTGIATIGMIEARQVCRNRMTTMTTRMTASKIVFMHLVDRFGDELGRVVDDVVLQARAGSCCASSCIVALMRSAVASAFEPGRWKISSGTACRSSR